MAGRKQFDPDEALDAAIDVFWRKSYSAASIQDLATATGLSRGSMYAAFGGKQELFLASLQRYVDLVGRPARTAVDLHRDDPRALAQASFDAILDRMSDPSRPAGCLLAQTAAESGSLEHPVQVAVRRILDDQVTHLQAVLAPHAPSGVDARSLAGYLVTTAQALAVMHRAGTPVDELRLTAAHAVTTLDILTPDAQPPPA